MSVFVSEPDLKTLTFVLLRAKRSGNNFIGIMLIEYLFNYLIFGCVRPSNFRIIIIINSFHNRFTRDGMYRIYLSAEPFCSV